MEWFFTLQCIAHTICFGLQLYIVALYIVWLRYIVLVGLAIFDYTNVQQLTNTSLALESRKQNMWPKSSGDHVGDHVFISPLTRGRFVSCRYKNAMYRGDPNLYQKPFWNVRKPPWVSRFHKIEALFTKSSSTPLKAKFHWRWNTEDMFFSW